MALFTIENLTFSYPEQTICAIDDLTLTVPEGAFVVLCGPSGCGKSTLLRQLKPALAPHGVRSGRICFRDTPLEQVDERTQAARIGFVQQSPENQIVTDKVWHELAFGLESLGEDTPTIRRRVAEMASFFGIEGWFYKSVTELSGGQKQLLNLASVMAMQPDVLILDEPIQVRKELTDEWDARGVQKGVEYAILTDEISRAWSGMSTRQYKNLKGLKKENLRDNMTTLELVLNMLAEATTTEISKQKAPETFSENIDVARAGGKVAGDARKAIESQTGVPVITSKNAVQLNQVVTDLLEGAATSPEKQDKKR